MTILWDWNGTLLSDVELALACDNAALADFGYPPLSLSEYLTDFDFPVEQFYLTRGVKREDIPLIGARFNENYDRAFPGTPLRRDALETVHRLEKAGARQAILSATHQTRLDGQLKQYPLLVPCMARIQGIRTDMATSKISAAHELMSFLSAEPAATCLIGDSLHDLETAHALHCRCLLISGGHQSLEKLQRSGAHVLSSLTEAADILLN